MAGLSGLRDTSQHAVEDEVVQRKHAVPIQETQQTLWFESSGLRQPRAIVPQWLDVECKRRHARQLHFGAELEQAAGLDAGDSPEVQRLTVSDGLGVTSTTPQPRTADEPVHDPADPPKP